MKVEQIQRVYEQLKQRHQLDFDLKDEQISILHGVLNKKNCMGILPTGFGKSLTYILPPLLLDELDPVVHHVSLVISPLRSLMQDQVKTLRSKGISAAAILKLSEMSEETVYGIRHGFFSIVFASPEAIKSETWMPIVRDKGFQRLVSLVTLVTIDEAHCVITWGTTFREDYSKLTWLGPVFKDSPLLFLTATCTPKMKEEILVQFSVESVQMTAAVPNRSNIFLRYRSFPDMILAKELSFYIEELKEKGTATRKCIIYTRVNQAGEIYEEFVSQLKERRYSDNGKPVVHVFVAKTSEVAKNEILNTFPFPESQLRCLIASTAFGLGVNIPDVELIIHWGVSSSVLDYWQEVGRCGRDGRPCESLLLATPRILGDKRSTQDCMRKLHSTVVKQKGCLRMYILKALYLDCMPKKEIERIAEKESCDGTCIEHGRCLCARCICCENCKQSCPCENLNC